LTLFLPHKRRMTEQSEPSLFRRRRPGKCAVRSRFFFAREGRSTCSDHRSHRFMSMTASEKIARFSQASLRRVTNDLIHRFWFSVPVAPSLFLAWRYQAISGMFFPAWGPIPRRAWGQVQVEVETPRFPFRGRLRGQELPSCIRVDGMWHIPASLLCEMSWPLLRSVLCSQNLLIDRK